MNIPGLPLEQLPARLPSTQRLRFAVENCQPLVLHGRIVQVTGTVVRAIVPRVKLGELCMLRNPGELREIPAEVIGFEQNIALLAPIGDMQGVSAHTQVSATGKVLEVPVGEALKGHVLDGMGNIQEDAERVLPLLKERYPIYANPPDPLARGRVMEPLSLGIRSLDSLVTCGVGQRIGIFAGAGVGKSSLLSMLVKHADADVYVAALIGERGREVLEFIEESLGEEGMEKTILVVATSDRPAIERLKAAYVATAVAEYFRDQGKQVLLLMDSLTRFARAQREIGLAAGEAPARRGYPPSVFSELPKLVERAGNSSRGSITAFYTVLIEGDDMNDPIADEVRSLLDGHIVLSRDLASANHYPAIDVLASLSRIMPRLTSPQHRTAASHLRNLLTKYKEVEFLLRVGEYQHGSDPLADEAIRKMDAIKVFLKQAPDDYMTLDQTVQLLMQLSG
ncbi:MAG TPA: type III secretion system ATPase SctN [Candidatus Thiothrix moscowensis]|uniref:type III secretion system ATPase SctN n=1 Tax=unclassified Thiothrix TaxID=2636184 RepID=UPI0026005BAB|nr:MULTISPECIES: type III secretion system ATPase SctN [unclassified Thiothrix]HRJ54048.1 type III secretion system ATPase SctN [Candidatus Thiothrix moscowensis]HRJ94194.1 type III secretion system ATPase SctN [Candidatus Thiothrix moscowensis]